jgi:hypothetical protein
VQQTAGVAGIHAESAGDLGERGVPACRYFVQDAPFGQAEAAVVEVLVEQPDLAGIEAIKGTDVGNLLRHVGHHGLVTLTTMMLILSTIPLP